MTGLVFMVVDVMVIQTPIFFGPVRFVFYIILWPLIALMRLKDTLF